MRTAWCVSGDLLHIMNMVIRSACSPRAGLAPALALLSNYRCRMHCDLRRISLLISTASTATTMEVTRRFTPAISLRAFPKEHRAILWERAQISLPLQPITICKEDLRNMLLRNHSCAFNFKLQNI